MTLSYRYLIDGPSLVHPEPDRLHAAFSIVITCALFLAFMAYVWILARRRRMRSWPLAGGPPFRASFFWRTSMIASSHSSTSTLTNWF